MTTTTATRPAPAGAPCGCKPTARDYTGHRRTRGTSLRDSQRSRLYRWERRELPESYTEDMTLAEAQAFADRIADDYGIPRIPIIGRRANTSACFSWQTDHEGKPATTMTRRAFTWNGTHYFPAQTYYCRIELPGWARNIGTICHEMAHYITATRYGLGECPGHGPEFAATFIELLARYYGQNEDELRASAAGQIAIAPRPDCPHQDNEDEPAPAPAAENPPAPAPAPATTETTGGQLAWAITDNRPRPPADRPAKKTLTTSRPANPENGNHRPAKGETSMANPTTTNPEAEARRGEIDTGRAWNAHRVPGEPASWHSNRTCTGNPCTAAANQPTGQAAEDARRQAENAQRQAAAQRHARAAEDARRQAEDDQLARSGFALYCTF